MAKEEKIVISSFYDAVGPSPLSGFEAVVGLDVVSKPGYAYPNFKATLGTPGAFTGEIISLKNNTEGTVMYALDDDNKIAKQPFAPSNVLPNIPTNDTLDIVYWKGYLFQIGRSAVYLTDDNGSTWVTSWDGDNISNSQKKFAYISNDGILYIVGGNKVYSLEEIGTFDPTDNSTFECNEEALTMPSEYDAIGIAEIGSYLYVAANAKGKGALFPWSKSDTESFYDPIMINEEINQIVPKDGLIYLNVGLHPSFKVTNGSSVTPLAKFPLTQFGVSANTKDETEGYFTFSPQAIDVVNDKIYFAFLTCGDTTNTPHGVYSFNPTNNAFQCENLVSSGSETNVSIGAIAKIDTSDPYAFRFGATDSDNSITAVNEVDNGNDRMEGAYLISQIERVGTQYAPKTFKRIEIYFGTPLDASGESRYINVYWRKDRHETWTEILSKEIDYGNTVMSLVKEIGSITTDKIQFKVEFGEGEGKMDLELITIE